MDSVVHFEIPAKDMSRASSFYQSVFGWQIQPVQMGDMQYSMVNTVAVDEKQMPVKPGAINGGMFPASDDPDAPVMIVVSVENLEEAVQKVKDAGGTMLVERKQVGDMGLYARFKDPEGNIMGLWQDLKNVSKH